MRFPLVRIAGACLALLASVPSRAQEEEWPAAMLELEKLALQSPCRNPALAYLARFASETGRFDQWRARWERRARQADGAAESLMLGWLAIEEGRADVARSWFARAAELSPENPHALLAHAESLLRTGRKEGETRVRRAVELFTDPQDKAGALRLAAVVAQEKGEFAEAWAHLVKLESEPLDAALRVALMSDFTRAHLALGDWEKWSAALLESSGKSAADAAACAGACLALGDPATAHRVVVEALKRDPTDTVLGRLATDAAIAARFAGDAAARIEASLGAQPSNDDLAAAINALATLGAPEHARRIFTWHAARLAPIAARWRQSLPLLWRLGATEGLHGVLAPHAAAGGWELQFVLCEIALLEKDTAAAEQALWQVLSREFDGHEITPRTRALAGKAVSNPPNFSLAGQRLRSRCYSWDSAVHTDRPVHSLTQARDIALRDLERLATTAGGDAPDKLAATLRERTAHWLPGERLLAFYFAREPAGILEAAEAAAALPNPSLDLRQCIRVAVSTIRKVPPLSAELTAAADALKARFPFEKDAPREEPMPLSWRARLLACWQLVGAGKLNEADTAFAAALRDFAEGGTGPDASAWASFHASLMHSVLRFPDKALKTEAAAQVLRWIGMQTPRRADWPTAARPQVLWTKSSQQQVLSMFGGDGSAFVAQTLGSEVQQTAVGGSVPADLFAPLAYFRNCFGWLNQRELGKALDAKLGDLPEECARTALLARGAAAASGAQMNEDSAWFARLRESGDAQPAQIAAAVSSLSAARFVGTKPSETAAAELLRAAPTGPVGRAAWLAATLHLIAHTNDSTDPVRLAAQLATMSADADTRSTADAAIELLLTKGRPDSADLRAVAGKLALAWLGKDEMEHLPAEWRTRLRILINSAETDAAATLALRILAQPLKPGTRLPETGGIRLEAIRALEAIGELPAWFSSLNRNASRDNPSDLRRLAQAAREILDVVKAPASRPAEEERPLGGRRKTGPPGGPDASMLRDARTAQFDAEVRLVHLEPEEIDHWMALWFSTDDGRNPGEKLGEKPVIENATLLRAARAGLPPVMAFPFAGDDPRNAVDLAMRWPAPPTQEPIGDTVGIASRLWHEGEKDAALGWLRKMSGTAPYFLIEALAVRGDSAGIVDALASALLAAARPAPALSPAFHLGRRAVRAEERPLAPLLDEASALGLSAPLAAKLAADPAPGAAALALLVRAREHDATAASAITACLAEPLRPILIEEFAWQLAGWPEGRDGAQAALRALKRSPPPPHSAADLSMQSARYGWLAARCGMESEADSWLNQAWGVRAIPGAPQGGEMLLTVAESMWRIGDRSRARAVAGDLAKSSANSSREAGRIATRLRQLAVDDEPALVRMLCGALSVTNQPANSELPAAISDATRNVAIREDRIYELTPFAWVRARRADGMGEFGWALGYSAHGRKNEKVLRVPDVPRPKSLRDSRLEIFDGPTDERLTRRATIVNPPPVGRIRLSTQEPGPMTSAVLSTGTLGPALRAIEGEDLLPAMGELPGTLLPALIWKKRAGGPDGDAISSSHRPSQGSTYGDLFHASLIELPAAAGKDIVISGWARHEKPNMMDGAAIGVVRPRDDASGRWVLQHTIPAAPLGGDWQRFETRLRAPHAEQPGRAAPVLALQLLPGCAYSGLRVTVPKNSSDADLPR